MFPKIEVLIEIHQFYNKFIIDLQPYPVEKIVVKEVPVEKIIVKKVVEHVDRPVPQVSPFFHTFLLHKEKMYQYI